MRIKLFLIFMFICGLSYSQDTLYIDYGKVPSKNIKLLTELLEVDMNTVLNGNDSWVFLFDLAVVESNGDWNAHNGDHLGLWQMGTLARKDAYRKSMDMGDGSLFEFYSDVFYGSPYVFGPEEQKKFVIFYHISIQDVMKEYINKYHGTWMNGIYITESGIVAASHLVGIGSVKKYFDSNGDIIMKDGNGISLEKYLFLFWNYEL